VDQWQGSIEQYLVSQATSASGAAKDATEHAPDDLAAHFASHRAGCALDQLFAGRGAAGARAAAENGAQAVEQAAAGWRRRCGVVPWRGRVTILAALVPLVGTAVVLIPAILFLFFTGST